MNVALAVLFIGAASVSAQSPVALHPIDLAAPYRATDYAYVRVAVGSRSIVQLGESIHLTDEFPRVRLRLVQHLHESMGFDVLALEGSVVNAWLAMERLYRAPNDTAAVAAAQEIAWFPLWDTSAMRELMHYVAATQGAASPLYLASFDMQAGQSRGTGERVFDQLFEALGRFSSASVDAGRWRTALLDASACRGTYSRASMDSAVRGITRWIDDATPAVARQRPAAHVAALQLVPRSLDQMARLCEAARSGVGIARQVTRDSLAAGNVFALRDSVSASHKVMTWGHHSHLYYNTLRGPLASMGQRLRATDSAAIYTVGLFAGAGSAYDITEQDRIPIERRRLTSSSGYGAERSLGSVARGSVTFIDLTRLDASRDAAFFATGAMRFEPRGSRPTILARDFDGAVFVDRVHPPTLLFGGALLAAVATTKGLWLDDSWSIIGLTLVIVVAIRVRARRSARRSS